MTPNQLNHLLNTQRLPLRETCNLRRLSDVYLPTVVSFYLLCYPGTFSREKKERFGRTLLREGIP